jgi:hypothetical protein
MSNPATFTALSDFLAQLSSASISFTLTHCHDDAIMVLVAVPGERWEVEFFAGENRDAASYCSAGD